MIALNMFLIFGKIDHVAVAKLSSQFHTIPSSISEECIRFFDVAKEIKIVFDKEKIRLYTYSIFYYPKDKVFVYTFRSNYMKEIYEYSLSLQNNYVSKKEFISILYELQNTNSLFCSLILSSSFFTLISKIIHHGKYYWLILKYENKKFSVTYSEFQEIKEEDVIHNAQIPNKYIPLKFNNDYIWMDISYHKYNSCIPPKNEEEDFITPYKVIFFSAKNNIIQQIYVIKKDCN